LAVKINWHLRYRQQAAWTETLRTYIFSQLDLGENARLLEIGCGTGAILESRPTAYGLDLRLASLQEAKVNAPTAPLTCGDAFHLPYAQNSFDVVFSHFLLLWLPNPAKAIKEMLRITRPQGHIIAFAEPDYTQRIDEPPALKPLGKWQQDALQAQGADPATGARLTALFHEAGMQIIETGSISKSTNVFDQRAWESEWAVLESDLAESISTDKIQKMKDRDLKAWQDGKRVLHVPTYYLWARMRGG
jgi:ubiquinone/menaquinone biosynthesis C-methylase UbiE